MPSPTKKTTKTGTGFRAAAALAAGLLALTGCAKVDTTAPSAARADVSAQARFGSVDCREANGAKSE